MDRGRGGIMHIAPVVLLFIMVLNGSLTAAEPASPFHTDRGDWCTEHRKFHSRLDVVQERVEKTVEYLYSEVNSVLDAISGSSWALSVAPSGPLLDIFEEDSR
ncbi:PREDICTED: placenta-specific protein 9-like [Nanorana parkeri]|uniref:placenta-specific protein 9-like n=1 Tax=Nanorana parkeri TaxID=125878 RepID=UPI000854FB4E|nr:PREDICTED: placenta-specific protein 9-like [Nanorana parkeri]